MREKINRIVNFSIRDKGHAWYDWTMIVVVLISLLPLTTHKEYSLFRYIDYVTTGIFIFDYMLRWMVADYSYNGREEKGVPRWKAFVFYPLRLSAIIDLFSILPLFMLIAPTFKLLRSWRIVRLLRIGRLFRYYEPLQVVIDVFRKKADVLFTVVCFAVFYILLTALVMFNVEYESNSDNHFFDTYWDAVYWATCTLTTVGYGDIYPQSAWGRAVSMVSALVGIAIIALPSGILTAGYMEEMSERRKKKRKKKENKPDKAQKTMNLNQNYS